jgi:integrase
MGVHRTATESQALTLAELERVRTAVQAWLTKDRPGPKSSSDMADIIELILATGARIGEVLALRWSDIDLVTKAVVVNATIKTETAKGTYRKATATARVIELTDLAVKVLKRRQDSASPNGIDAVFPTRTARGSKSTTSSGAGDRCARRQASSG